MASVLLLVMGLTVMVTGRSHGSYHEPQPSPHSQPALLPSPHPLPAPQSQSFLQARPRCGPATVWLEVTNTRMVPSVTYHTVTSAVPTTVTAFLSRTILSPSTATLTVTSTLHMQYAVEMSTKYATSTKYVTAVEVLGVTQFDTSTTSLFVTEVVVDSAFVTHTRTHAQYSTLTETVTENITVISTSWLTVQELVSVTQTNTSNEYVTETKTSRYKVTHTLTETSYDQAWVVVSVTSTRHALSCYWG